MKHIDIMLCINKPDNGNYSGRLACLDISDVMRLEPRVLPEPRCSRGTKHFSIHHRKITVSSWSMWVGNWCWDSIRTTTDQAAKMIEGMLSARYQELTVWGFDEASGESAMALMSRHDKGETITAEEIKLVLEQEGAA